VVVLHYEGSREHGIERANWRLCYLITLTVFGAAKGASRVRLHAAAGAAPLEASAILRADIAVRVSSQRRHEDGPRLDRIARLKALMGAQLGG
jgi:hypothetical protein